MFHVASGGRVEASAANVVPEAPDRPMCDGDEMKAGVKDAEKETNGAPHNSEVLVQEVKPESIAQALETINLSQKSCRKHGIASDAASTIESSEKDSTGHDEDAVSIEEETSLHGGTRDPIQMFGLFSPPALRSAQAEAIKMVEEVVPRLVSIDAEMREVEIAVRRARKHRGKLETEVFATAAEFEGCGNVEEEDFREL